MKCWWCSGDLIEKGGKLIYDVFVDSLGHRHKVHKSCAERCEDESKITAQAVGEIDCITGVITRPTGIPLED